MSAAAAAAAPVPKGKDPMEQVKFLVTCIAHANNGKPDFQAVADELEICSRAAAQKRYERMLKANGVTNKPAAAKSAPAKPASSSPPTPKRKAAATGGRGKKARKTAAAVKTEETPLFEDECQQGGPVKKEETEEESATSGEHPQGNEAFVEQ